MQNVYELAEPIEGYTHVKVNFEIDQIYVNGDLGNLEEKNDEVVFEPKYTSAVINKSLIINYEPQTV